MLRPLRRRFGISASRMAVRPEAPWYWKSLTVLGLAAVFIAVGWTLARVHGGAVGPGGVERELVRLQETLERQENELKNLRSRVAQNEGQVQIDRAAATDLGKQVKALSVENAALKEDLAFFQSLMSGAGEREGTLSVNRFRLQPEASAGEYRYQMLLVQNSQRAKEFNGRLQLVIDVQHEGRKLVLTLPSEAEREGRDYQLSFKFFQRIEGTFRLMPGSVLKGMQVRVFENGARTPKLSQTLSVS